MFVKSQSAIATITALVVPRYARFDRISCGRDIGWISDAMCQLTRRPSPPRHRRHRRRDRGDPRADRLGRMGRRERGFRGRPTSPKQLGLSRNSLREAVRALSLARVLEVRQGDGTYVSSLEPGRAARADALRRRICSAAAPCSSCSRCGGCSSRRRPPWPRCARTTRWSTRPAARARADARRGRPCGRARRGGRGLPRRDRRARRATPCCARCCGASRRERCARGSGTAWPTAGRSTVARAEHTRIYDAIAAGDADLARAATLLHIANNEAWLATTSGRPTTCR